MKVEVRDRGEKAKVLVERFGMESGEASEVVQRGRLTWFDVCFLRTEDEVREKVKERWNFAKLVRGVAEVMF